MEPTAASPSDSRTESRGFNAELRSKSKDSRTIGGHAAVVGSVADLGLFREIIQPGAFEESIRHDDIRSLWNHNDDHVLGRTKNGTLRLSEDERGLNFEADLPDTQFANDALVLIRDEYVTGMSFRFEVILEEWDWEKNLRTLQQVRLFEVSPVTFPAYVGTDVAMRSIRAHEVDVAKSTRIRNDEYYTMRLRLLDLEGRDDR